MNLVEVEDDPPPRPAPAPMPAAPPQRFFFPPIKLSAFGDPVELAQVDSHGVAAVVSVDAGDVLVMQDGTALRLPFIPSDLAAALRARRVPQVRG